jgi:predicted dithiol-disulfide oxidoreductase (DUF899 family)
MKNKSFDKPTVVSPEKWLAARLEFLREEKEFTKMRDRLSEHRRQLPWVRVDSPYFFDSPTGRVSLADLFGKHSQLAVYHFMFGPGWEAGCPACSFVSDSLAPSVVHLQARDVAFVAISRAPLSDIVPFKKRMGWNFNWVSSHESDFNFDYNVSFTAEQLARGKVNYNYHLMDFPKEEAPGMSIFAKDSKGDVYHTFSTFGRGLDILIGTYNVLDLVPKGRDEEADGQMSWLRYHDSYEQPADAVAAH